MQVLDWAILIFVTLGAIWGFAKGFIKQLASLVGLIAGLLVARALYLSVGERLATETGISVTVGQVIAFFLIWLCVPLVVSILASMLTKVIEVIHLSFINRVFGALLGGIKFSLFISLLIYFIEYVDYHDEIIKSAEKKASVLYYPMKEISGMFVPVLKNATIKLIDTNIYEDGI